MFRTYVRLRNPYAASLRIELAIGEIASKDQKNVAIGHGVIARRKADQPGHADVVRIVPFHTFFAAQSMHDRRLQPLAERQQFFMGSGATRPAKNGYPLSSVQHVGEAIEFGGLRRDHRLRRPQPSELGPHPIGRRTKRDITGNDDNGNAALSHSLADGCLKDAWHLIGARDQLTIVATLSKEDLGMAILKVPHADLCGRNVCSDRKHWHARTMTIKKAVDEMEIAWPAASGTDGELAGQMCLGTGRKGGHFLVPDMNPVDASVTADRIGKAIQAIPNDSIDALDAHLSKSVGELICNRLRHDPCLVREIDLAKRECLANISTAQRDIA